MHDPDDHADDDQAAESSPAPDSSLSASPSATGQATLLDELLVDEHVTAAREPAAPVGGLRTRVGRIVEWSSGSAPKVEFPGNQRGPLPARSIVALDPTTIAEAIASARGVVLSFEDDHPEAPIITGLLHDFSAVTEAPQVWDQDEPEPEPELAQQVEARVDGRRIEFEAADEIVLRCGQASIVLRRNGRVVIRGTYVESRSRGVNRIKGGSVQIN